MHNRTDEERQQRAGIVAAALPFAAFGVLWLLGFGWADGLALGFGGLCLGFVLAYPTPRILRSGFPRVALAVAALAVLIAGLATGVAGFSTPSALFFWGVGFGFLLVAVRGVMVA